MPFLFEEWKEITNFALEKKTKTVKVMKNRDDLENLAAWKISVAIVIMLFLGGNLIYFDRYVWGILVVLAMTAVIVRTFRKLNE